MNCASVKDPAADARIAGLELLASAVLLIDARRIVRYMNPAAENLFELSARQAVGRPMVSLLGDP